jgi:hypothetical protein
MIMMMMMMMMMMMTYDALILNMLIFYPRVILLSYMK